MEAEEARSRIREALSLIDDYCSVGVIALKTGVPVDQCRRILDLWVGLGIVSRIDQAGLPTAYIRAEALK